MTTATRDHRPTALVFPHPLRRHGGRLLGSLSLALALAACGDKAASPVAQQGPAQVGVITLQTQQQQLDATLPGRTRASLTAEVRPQVSGIVQQRLFTEGALVTANQTNALTTIVQMDPMYVDFTQSSNEIVQLRRDWDAGRYQKLDGNQARVRIRLDDGSDYAHEGRLQFAGMIVNDSTGTVTLRAVVPNPEGVLMPGMYVQALLPTGLASDALLIPQQAVNRDLTGRANVLVVNADDVVEKRPVELARALGSRWLLDSGLVAGERLVVDGFQRVKPGDKVSPQPVVLKTSKGEAGPPQAPEDGLRPRNGQGVNIATPQAGAPR